MYGDITDPVSVREAVQNVDVVFHVAADYRLWVPDPQRMHSTNVDGAVQICRAATDAGASRIVYTSSVVTVRGSKENGWNRSGFHTDSMNVGVVYQRTKVLAEQAVWDLIAKGMPITIVNPSTPIGAGDRQTDSHGTVSLSIICLGVFPPFSIRDLELGF